MAADPGAGAGLVVVEEAEADLVVLEEVHLEGAARVAAGELRAALRSNDSWILSSMNSSKN